MGNLCGCVRGPKEEGYVDPKQAPLKPASKELKGRRYFQRKKRKSEIADESARTAGVTREVHRDGQVPVPIEDHPTEGFRPGRLQPVEETLSDTHVACRPASSRAVSFGAVEHMLCTLRGGEVAFESEITCSSQSARRRRRRASVCSGYLERRTAPAKCDSIQHKV